jgi:hypothetical protein
MRPFVEQIQILIAQQALVRNVHDVLYPFHYAGSIAPVASTN